MSAAARIPLLSGLELPLTPPVGVPNSALGALGAAIAVLEGVQQINQYHANWISYRSTCEALKHEKYLYLGKAGPYAAVVAPSALLAERVELLVLRSTQNGPRPRKMSTGPGNRRAISNKAADHNHTVSVRLLPASGLAHSAGPNEGAAPRCAGPKPHVQCRRTLPRTPSMCVKRRLHWMLLCNHPPHISEAVLEPLRFARERCVLRVSILELNDDVQTFLECAPGVIRLVLK